MVGWYLAGAWIVAGGALAVALVALARAYPAPRQLGKAVDHIAERQDSLESRWLGAKADYERVLEEIEGILDSVERKRRRAAAAASKIDKAEQAAQPELNRRDQLRQVARERGFRV